MLELRQSLSRSKPVRYHSPKQPRPSVLIAHTPIILVYVALICQETPARQGVRCRERRIEEQREKSRGKAVRVEEPLACFT